MRVKLRVMQGAQAGREVVIPVAEFLIGRGEECHLRPRSDALSREHCAILVKDNQVFVRDLDSKNGSFINGEPVTGDQLVENGDQFLVGPLAFEIVIEKTLGGAKRPAARDVKEVAARTATSGSEDLDIASWLEDEDDTDVSRAVAGPETRQFRLDETSRLALETQIDGKSANSDSHGAESEGESAVPEGESAVAEGSEDEEDKKKSDRWKKSEPGKLPPRPKSSTVDSREAAADMLKKFFNRG